MSTKSKSRALTAIILILIFSAIYLLNFFTPYVADDFNNITSMTDGFKPAVRTVFNNQIDRYYHTNGAVIAYFLGGVALCFNYMTITVLNTILFCIFILQICRFRTEKKPETINEELPKRNRLGYLFRPLLIVFTFLMLWYFTPAFGQDFLWKIGSANYLWMSIILLTILRSVRKQAVLEIPASGFLRTLFLIIFSVIAGWTNEFAVISILFIVFYYLVKTINNRSESIFMIFLMWVSMMVGFILMVSAPGNFIRLSKFKEPSGINKYLFRLSKMNAEFLKYILIIGIVVVIALIIARAINFKKSYESEVYAIGGLVAFYSNILFPTFPKRAMLFTILLFIISIVLSLAAIYRKKKGIALLILVGSIGFLGMDFVTTYPKALSLNKDYTMEFKLRDEDILRQKIAGRNTYVNVNGLIAENKYMAAYELGDVRTDIYYWQNQAMARYYGVETVYLMKNIFFK